MKQKRSGRLHCGREADAADTTRRRRRILQRRVLFQKEYDADAAREAAE